MKLPHNLDAEKAALGAFLLDSDITYLGLPLLEPEYFYDAKHKLIYTAIQDVSKDGLPVDFITVADKLQERNQLENVGGTDYLTNLMQSTPTSLHIEHYAGIVKNYYKLRTLIITSSGIIQEAQVANPEEVSQALDKSLEKLYNIFTDTDRQSTSNSREMMEEFWNFFQRRYEEPGKVDISTGFIELDAVIDGYAATDLIIVAGRPSWGKTSLVMNSILRVGKAGVPCVLFTYEMSRLQTEQRFISTMAGVNLQKIKTAAGLTSEEISSIVNCTGEFAEYPVWIDNNSSGDIYYLTSAIRRYHRQHGVKVFFIDYLQNIPLLTDNATTEIGRMTRILKGLATSLGITIVLVSQLNRKIESEKRKPKLSDLRQSGEIEEDSDVVIFVYRNLEGDTPEDTEIMIAKNRNGPIGSFNLYFDEECVRFIGRE